MAPRVNKAARLLPWAQWLLPLLLSALVSYGTAQSRAGAAEAATSLKIESLESRFSELDRNVVPRREHEAHWQAIEELLRQQQTDLREVRSTQREILLRLSSR